MKHVLVRDSGSKFQYKGLEAQIYIYNTKGIMCRWQCELVNTMLFSQKMGIELSCFSFMISGILII